MMGVVTGIEVVEVDLELEMDLDVDSCGKTATLGNLDVD